MSEENKEVKKPAAKKPAAPKAEKSAAPKAAPKAKAEKADAPAKPKAKQPAKQEKSGATIRVIQTGSVIGRQAVQQKTLIGLGLNKRLRERTLEDTPAVRGMIEKVKHLVKVVG